MYRILTASISMILLSTSCATSFRNTPTPALSPFVFQLTPEQCEKLRQEYRNYRSVEKTAAYVGGAGALMTTVFLAVPALRDEQAAQGAAAGVGLLAGGVGAFSGTQVDELGKEIHEGGCR